MRPLRLLLMVPVSVAVLLAALWAALILDEHQWDVRSAARTFISISTPIMAAAPAAAAPAEPKSFLELSALDAKKKEQLFSQYAGKG
jgi:hypothetical protein